MQGGAEPAPVFSLSAAARNPELDEGAVERAPSGLHIRILFKYCHLERGSRNNRDPKPKDLCIRFCHPDDARFCRGPQRQGSQIAPLLRNLGWQ